VPLTKGSARDLRTHLVGLLQGPLGIPQTLPFALTEWTPPRGRGWAIDLRSLLHAVDVSLLGRDTFFGGPGQPLETYDWPRPRGKRWPVVEGSHGIEAMLQQASVSFGPTARTSLLLDRISRRLALGEVRTLTLEGVRYLVWNAEE